MVGVKLETQQCLCLGLSASTALCILTLGKRRGLQSPPNTGLTDRGDKGARASALSLPVSIPAQGATAALEWTKLRTTCPRLASLPTVFAPCLAGQ